MHIKTKMDRLTTFLFFSAVISIASAQTGYGHALNDAVVPSVNVTSAFLLPCRVCYRVASITTVTLTRLQYVDHYYYICGWTTCTG